MVRNTRRLVLALTAVSLMLFGTGRVLGDCNSPPVVYPPAPQVAYYPPAPQVAYYPPAVAYAPPVPQVSYYAPAVSYYAPAPQVAYYPPAVSYYAPAPSYYAPRAGATTTTYYGLFGRPRETVTRYYP